jgi:hypothetical protein
VAFYFHYLNNIFLDEPNSIGELAIQRIQSHMNHEPETYISSLGMKTEAEIERKQNGFMKRMKSYTATTWVVYRISKKMIEVDHHSSDHY